MSYLYYLYMCVYSQCMYVCVLYIYISVHRRIVALHGDCMGLEDFRREYRGGDSLGYCQHTRTQALVTSCQEYLRAFSLLTAQEPTGMHNSE